MVSENELGNSKWREEKYIRVKKNIKETFS